MKPFLLRTANTSKHCNSFKQEYKLLCLLVIDRKADLGMEIGLGEPRTSAGSRSACKQPRLQPNTLQQLKVDILKNWQLESITGILEVGQLWVKSFVCTHAYIYIYITVYIYYYTYSVYILYIDMSFHVCWFNKQQLNRSSSTHSALLPGWLEPLGSIHQWSQHFTTIHWRMCPSGVTSGN